MLSKIKKAANKSDRELTFEIGSNSDLILENTITNNLIWTIENFSDNKKGFLTFPTKFDMVEPILNLKGKERVIIRMSVNPQEIISNIEFGTSKLDKRINAINKLKDAGYKVGLLVAPIVLVENWKTLYTKLFEELNEKLSDAVKKDVFFELIFMTYSYVHRMINQDAFPNAINLYSSELMTGRGRGKYMYKPVIKEEASKFFRDLLSKFFPNNEIIYIV